MYTIGLDFGTNTVRAIVVRTSDGAELGTYVHPYVHGEDGIVLDERDPNLARQHPKDYLDGLTAATKGALAAAGILHEQVDAIGVDTTGSTPLPLDARGTPLAFTDRFAANPAAMAWLWKDHTGTAEAEEITARAAATRPHYLAKCGGSYSSEWFFSKIWHCLRSAPEVFDAAHTWIECADWIPAVLTGTDRPGAYKVGVCAAGHKAMFNAEWGGLPDKEFLASLDPALAELRGRLYDVAHTSDTSAGGLSREWAERLGLREEIPVAVGAFDAHLGAVGAGIKPGALVKIIGTSTCDMMVHPASAPLTDIPGLAGIVNGSILPGYYGLEAGQSAVGDIFNWFVAYSGHSHEQLTAGAAKLSPGASGLLALDWNNGNRCVLGDQRLTGLLLGQTLHTTPAETYRALIEATAYGALTIIERLEEYGVTVETVVNCGGIAEKSPLVMQVYADVTGRGMRLSRSSQTCALGSAIAAAVVAGHYPDFPSAQAAMCGMKEVSYEPDPSAHATYRRLYGVYRRLHDEFSTAGGLGSAMKDLISIRDEAR